MSERTVSDLCRAVLEHDEMATKGPWTYKHNYSFTGYGHQIVAHRGECRLATVDESVGEHDEIRLPGDGPLIAHYRSACPTIAREYLRLAERLALAEAVCEGVAMYATIETDERLLMLHHKWLIAKDPQGEGKA